MQHQREVKGRPRGHQREVNDDPNLSTNAIPPPHFVRGRRRIRAKKALAMKKSSRVDWYLPRPPVGILRYVKPTATEPSHNLRYTVERRAGYTVFWLGERVHVRTVAPSVRPLAGPWKPPRPTGITRDREPSLVTEVFN
jgi:hypothetical protein